MKICLLSCAAKKTTKPSPAANLYTSPLFCKTRKLVEANNHPWFILSAKHGLLEPSQIIKPYDLTLNKLPMVERKKWAAKVIKQMDKKLPIADEIIILAGKKYYENLMSYLDNRFKKTTIKMKPIGKQLQWLGNAKKL